MRRTVAGIGDEIVAMNGTPVTGMSSAEVSDLLQRLFATEGLRVTARRHLMLRLNR